MEPSKEEFESLKNELAELKAKMNISNESKPIEPELVDESTDLVTNLIVAGSEVVGHWIDKKSETEKYVADKQAAIAEKRLNAQNTMHKRDTIIKLLFVTIAIIALVVLSINGTLGDASIALISVLIASVFGSTIKGISQQSKE